MHLQRQHIDVRSDVQKHPKGQKIYSVRLCIQKQRSLCEGLHGNKHLLTACTVVHSMLKKAECELLHNQQTGTEYWEGNTCRQGFTPLVFLFFKLLPPENVSKSVHIWEFCLEIVYSILPDLEKKNRNTFAQINLN